MISRRGLLGSVGLAAGGAGALRRRADQEYDPPSPAVGPGGRTGIFRGRLVVITGGTPPGSGIFVYFPTAGTGKLTASIAATSGTDQYGNTVEPGFASYAAGDAGVFVRMSAGQIVFSSINPSSLLAGTALLQLNDVTLASQRPALVVESPKANASLNGSSVVQLFGESNDGTAAPVVVISTLPSALPTSTALLEVQGNVDISTVGKGLAVKEGSNAKQGTATLSAGTILVANTSVTANSRIFLTAQDNSSTGALRVSARTAGTSFTITSSNAADSGVVAYEIFEPG